MFEALIMGMAGLFIADNYEFFEKVQEQKKQGYE